MTARDMGFLASIAALVLDQASKLLLLYGFGFADMLPGQHVAVLPGLDLVMMWNSGVSFSFLAGNGALGTAFLSLFTLAVVGVLGWWLWRVQTRVLAVGLGLVIGGALGNLVDRLIYGRVADFFDLHLAGRDFFACNVADIAISLGVLLLLFDVVADSGAGSPSLRRGAE